MKLNFQFFLFMIGAIFAAGIILDEAGSGRLGGPVKGVAQKITRGFGV